MSTNIVPINILYSGKVNGGITKGKVTQMSADSSLGKTMIGFALLKQAQRKGMGCIVIDTERTWDAKLAKINGVDIDADKLMVFQSSEMIKIKQFIKELYIEKEDSKGAFVYYPREDRRSTFILFDSWGTIMTQNQTSKALDGSTTMDMGRSTIEKNELANSLNESACTVFVINHVLANLGGFGDPLSIPGGKKLYFISDGIGMATSSKKSKDGEEGALDNLIGGVKGKIVTCLIKKGRNARESKKIQFRINYEDTGDGGGIDQWFGFLELALEHGCVKKGKEGYERPCVENDDSLWDEWAYEKKGKEFKNLYSADFWLPIFKATDFGKWLEDAFAFSSDEELAVAKTDIADEFDKMLEAPAPAKAEPKGKKAKGKAEEAA